MVNAGTRKNAGWQKERRKAKALVREGGLSPFRREGEKEGFLGKLKGKRGGLARWHLLNLPTPWKKKGNEEGDSRWREEIESLRGKGGIRPKPVQARIFVPLCKGRKGRNRYSMGPSQEERERKGSSRENGLSG